MNLLSGKRAINITGIIQVEFAARYTRLLCCHLSECNRIVLHWRSTPDRLNEAREVRRKGIRELIAAQLLKHLAVRRDETNIRKPDDAEPLC